MTDSVHRLLWFIAGFNSFIASGIKRFALFLPQVQGECSKDIDMQMNIWCHLATSRCLSEQPTCTSEGRRGSNTKHANGTSCPRRLCVSIIVYGEWAGLHSSYIHLFVTSFSPGKPHSASIWSHSRLWRYVWKKNGGVRGDFEGSTFAGTGSKGNERLFEKHSCQMTACHVYVRQIFSHHHTHWTRERMHYQWGWHGNTGGGRGGEGVNERNCCMNMATPASLSEVSLINTLCPTQSLWAWRVTAASVRLT